MASLILLFCLCGAEAVDTLSTPVQILGKSEGKECRGLNTAYSWSWSLMNNRGLRDVMASGTWLRMTFFINACYSW